ncbi:MAG: glycosyltransferase family 4 protein [Candidatus Sumerlaeia bacterium]|nr:glycosyltransferase family 4 protein [Candidatus Sumerlaeia bacterium]
MKLKVLQICAVDFTVKNFLLPLIKFLELQGFEVTTVCTPGEFFHELRQQGINLHGIPIARSFNLWRHLISGKKLFSFIRQHRFQIVHTHTPVASLIGRITARLAGVPIILYTAHGFYFHERMSPTARQFHIWLEKIAALFCDFIFTQSEEDRQTAIKLNICKEHKIAWIGNGIDLHRFNPANIKREDKENLLKELGLEQAQFIVGIIGRLVREKGFMEFFTAASQILKRYPKTYFLVIGDALVSDYDASKAEIHRHIEQLGIKDHVRFTGFRSDIPQLLSLMNVYTLPSYREGMPRSIIEAMAMAKPVVATNIRGCREEIVDGKTGFLVPVGDATALAEAILRLLENPELAEEIGKRGRDRAIELYDEQLVLQRQLEVYKKLIQRKLWQKKF